MKSHVSVLGVLLMSLLGLGCGSKEEAAPPPPALDVGPPVGVLELPVSLRTSDAVPGDARKVDVSLGGVRVDGQPLFALERAKVPAAERSGDILPKLEAALATPAKKALALTVHATVPYETAALVLSTARAAGMSQLALQVRKPGGSTTPGWLLVQSFEMTPRTDDDVALASVEPRTWDEFTGAWQAISDACRTGQTATCAYVPGEVAKGGKLKTVLYAAGQGVNVDFYRVGLTPAELAAEAEQRKVELAAKQAEADKGKGNKGKGNKGKGNKDGPSAQKDIVAELTEREPANEAMFQFRGREALAEPSPVTAMMKPLCGTKACGSVVSAEGITLMIGVVSLIGAAYADGSPPPVLAFEMPWTKRPIPPAVPVAAPAAPAP